MSVKEGIRRTFEILTTFPSDIKEKAQEVAIKLHESKDFRLSTGVVTQEELDCLAQNPNQEKLYKDMFHSYLRSGNFPEERLENLSLAQQSDIGLRHARWLANRFNFEETGK